MTLTEIILDKIKTERIRQIEQEGWSPSHDDNCHQSDQLAWAAAAYAIGRKDARIELSTALTVCNTTKKLLRHRDSVAGNIKIEDKDIEALKAKGRKELADVIIYADLAIQALDGDTSETIREVFNAKSLQLGSDILV